MKPMILLVLLLMSSCCKPSDFTSNDIQWWHMCNPFLRAYAWYYCPDECELNDLLDDNDYFLDEDTKEVIRRLCN